MVTQELGYTGGPSVLAQVFAEIDDDSTGQISFDEFCGIHEKAKAGDLEFGELERVMREAKRDEEWEQRARQIEAEELTLHHMKVEEEKRKKEAQQEAKRDAIEREEQRKLKVWQKTTGGSRVAGSVRLKELIGGDGREGGGDGVAERQLVGRRRGVDGPPRGRRRRRGARALLRRSVVRRRGGALLRLLRLALARGRAVGRSVLANGRGRGARAFAPNERARPVEVAAGVAERLAGVLLAQALELGQEHVARERRICLGHGFCSACRPRACIYQRVARVRAPTD